MKRAIAIVTLGVLATSTAAFAQERATDAALGAVSGAVVLGPVGAVAGALVGYTAGPSIAHSWHLRRSRAPRQAHRPTRLDDHASTIDSEAANAQASAPTASAPAAASPPSPAPAMPRSGSTPPVQPLE
jgi:hypothetical protein